jgi:hypothetical protein
MRDIKRIKRILKDLELIWMSPDNQDMRLGQLLININSVYEKHMWFVEDDDLEYCIRQFKIMHKLNKKKKKNE